MKTALLLLFLAEGLIAGAVLLAAGLVLCRAVGRMTRRGRKRHG